MTTRVDLPSGHFVELEDAHVLSTKQIKSIMSCITDSDKDIQSSFEVVEAMANRLITHWDYEHPIPSVGPLSTDDVITDFRDYKALTDALKPAMDMLRGVEPDPSTHADPASPMLPSNA